MGSSSLNHGKITKSSLLVLTFVMLAFMFSAPASASLMNLNVIEEIRNSSWYAIGNYTNMSNISFTQPELKINVTGNSSTVYNISIFIDGNPGPSYNVTNNTALFANITTRLLNGTHTAYVQLNSTNDANVLWNSTNITFTVDDAKPVLNYTIATGATLNATNTSDATPEIIINVTDNGFTLINTSIYVDGVYDHSELLQNNTLGRLNLSARANGTFVIRLEANDSAGNLANTTANGSATYLTIYIYNNKPVVNIISFPTGNTTVNATNSTNTSQIIIFNVTRTGNYTNPTFLNYTIFIDGNWNGSGLINNDTNITATISTFRNGTHSVWVQAIDPANNTANSTIYTITTDSEAPYITINSPGNMSNLTATPVIKFTIIDNSSSSASLLNYTIFVDGAVNGQTGFATNGSEASVTLTAMSNITHNITIQVSDFLNNTRNSSVLTIQSDLTAPTLTIATSPATIYRGGAVTITCTASDNFPGVNSSSATSSVTKPNGVTTSGACSTDFTDTTASGTYTVTYSLSDWSGNRATKTATFTVSDSGGASSSSSSSSSSGGSSSSSTPSTTSSKSILVDAFTPEKSNVVTLTSDTIGIKEISVDVANRANSVEIKVTKTDAQPATVTKSVEGKVYQYIQIDHDTLKNENIKAAKVKFTVTKKWLTDNSVSKDNVVLKRYADNTWSNMKTTLLSEGTSEITYQAELPGLSVFAIGVDTSAQTSPATQQPATGQPATGQPSSQGQQPSSPQTTGAGTPPAASADNMMYYYAGGIILVLILIYAGLKLSRGKKKRK